MVKMVTMTDFGFGGVSSSLAEFMFFFFKQKTAYEIGVRLVGSEMCIRDRQYIVTYVKQTGSAHWGPQLGVYQTAPV